MAKLILVTGGAGFIGSSLCARLVADGHKVISLDNYFAGTKDAHVAGVDYREGHTKDIATHVPETPDMVFHLGEYSRVEKSLLEPAVVWDLNKAGTFGVLEFCRTKGCKLLYAGSSTKFGDGGLGRDQSPYAWTKATNTEMVRNYGDWYGLKYAITYFYNVYGPGERAGAYGTLIEIFRQRRLAGEHLRVNAPGTQKRNFTHIDDIVEGLVLVGESGEGDDFGLGDSRAYSILEVAEMFGGEIVMGPEVAGNRMSADIDTSKTRLLGWAPSRALIDYIAQTPGAKTKPRRDYSPFRSD
jgi:UDP-glucose 4-epimerase